jgi:hypothetical protein
MKKLLCILSALMVGSYLNAQTPGEEYSHNDIFKGFLGWDVRVGGENSKNAQTYTNTITGDLEGESKATYKNTRVTIDGLVVEGTLGLFAVAKRRIKVGIPYGFNAGLSPQKKVSTYTSWGNIPNDGWGSGFGGNQGMEISDNLTINFELKLGGAIAYDIVPAKNIQLSVGYNCRFWSKGNLAFYANPNFFGGFFDVNATYKRWAVNTTFKALTEDFGQNNGKMKTGYFSIMPTYNMPLRNKEKNKFRNGLNTIGLRIETSYARADDSSIIVSSRYDYTLRAHTFMMGIYFGFLL